MNSSFQLARIPRIYFGKGKIQLLGGEMAKFGKKALVLTSKKSFKSQEIKAIIEKNGIQADFAEIENEPSPAQIDSICSEFRTKEIQVVAGIGGGSVMDAGKAISAMLTMEGSVKDYLEGVGTKSPTGNKIPYLAVPTTSGTGSETTANAVLTETGENGFKKSLRHPNFVPDLALVDPELTLSCPRELTAATGMDAFTQLLESYLSLKSSVYTDILAFEGIKHSIQAIKKAYLDGKDLEARASLSFASMTSGITLTNAGLGTVHGFASSIGGLFKIPHGVVCGTLMAACNKMNVQKLRQEAPECTSLEKYAEVGKLFTENKSKNNDYYIDLLIDKLYEMTAFLSIPKLSAFGIKENDIHSISAITENKNNPVGFSQNEMNEILLERL
ncbi:MAG: iron-containing alcohol dehydrogenase [Bacteroidales bacterium]